MLKLIYLIEQTLASTSLSFKNWLLSNC